MMRARSCRSWTSTDRTSPQSTSGTSGWRYAGSARGWPRRPLRPCPGAIDGGRPGRLLIDQPVETFGQEPPPPFAHSGQMGTQSPLPSSVFVEAPSAHARMIRDRIAEDLRGLRPPRLADQRRAFPIGQHQRCGRTPCSCHRPHFTPTYQANFRRSTLGKDRGRRGHHGDRLQGDVVPDDRRGVALPSSWRRPDRRTRPARPPPDAAPRSSSCQCGRAAIAAASSASSITIPTVRACPPEGGG